jgi:hypothetical protein
MEHFPDLRSNFTSRWLRPACLGLMLFLTLGSLMSSKAQAAFEQVQNFGDNGEAIQFNRASALAINTTGAGGVPAGTIYATTEQRSTVVRYGPSGEFNEAWGWNVSVGGSEQFERCGPGGEPTHPECKALSPENNSETGIEVSGTGGEGTGPFGEATGQLYTPLGIAVDQKTGYVYVLNQPGGSRKTDVIQVFSADGSELVASFGTACVPVGAGICSETFAESPAKLHAMTRAGFAVNGSGEVFVSDNVPASGGSELRIMSFRPVTAGDYEHYEYAGRAKDINGVFGRLAFDEAGNLYLSEEDGKISEFAGGQPGSPVCRFNNPTGGISGFTVDPSTGAPFYFTYKRERIEQLSSCNGNGEFMPKATISVDPKTTGNFLLAYDPALSYSPNRSAGTLFGVDTELHLGKTPSQNVKGLGHIFAPAEAFPPAVEAESLGSITSTSAIAKARVDPKGFETGYAVQYLTAAQYEQNEPNERQSLTIEAQGGLFSAAFRGRQLGGAATASLAAGSDVISNVTTASATATVSAGKGTADLSGAVGSGTVIAGSTQVTAASANEGAFAIGQTISGEGIPSGATVTAISGSELTLSVAASTSKANIILRSGTDKLTSVAASEGAFVPGQVIEGPGIPSGTTIESVGATEMTLSAPFQGFGTGVAIAAGATTLSGLSGIEGTFEPGTPVSGEGIPAATKITAVGENSLEISKAPTKAGAMTVSSSGPAPLAVGEEIEGPGIPPGTKIVSITSGQLKLSAPAETTVAGVHLQAGMSFDADAGSLRRALEGLPTIGPGNVAVSGGPGDESGSDPYEVEFVGALADEDLPEFQVDGTHLSGPATAAVVTTVKDGGSGFDHGVSEAPSSPGKVLPGAPVNAAVTLSGLSPETAYRFRFVASSSCEEEHPDRACEAAGPAVAFSTYAVAASSLPDGRAYELVSPTAKNGGEPFPLNPNIGSCGLECKPGINSQPFPRVASPDGEELVYEGQPFSPNEGPNVYNEYLAHRTAAGWATTVLAPKLMNSSGAGYKGFSSDLSQGLLYQLSPPLSSDAPENAPDLYSQPTANPVTLTPILTEAPPNRSAASGFKMSYGGSSADFSRLFFAANDALTGSTPVAPEAPLVGPTAMNLYEYTGGELRLVNVLPGNEEAAPGAHFGAPALESNNFGNSVSNLLHVISEDGSRAFWTSGSGQIYVRIAGSETRIVSESQRTPEDPIGEQPTRYLAASSDGSRALFSSSQELTDDADTGPIERHITVEATKGTFTLTFGGRTTAALPFNITASALQAALEGLASVGNGNVKVVAENVGFFVTFSGPLAESEELITGDGSALKKAGNAQGSLVFRNVRPGKDLYLWAEGKLTDLTSGHGIGAFQGIAGQSEDLSRIFFVDRGVLAGENDEHKVPDEHGDGENNLYAWNEGAISFIATLADGDNKVAFSGGDWSSPSGRTAEASPDGHWLTFVSQEPLTGYENVGSTCARSGDGKLVTAPCLEVFLWSARGSTLSCVSCNRSNALPLGPSYLPSIPQTGGIEDPLPQVRYLTNSGRLYFDSEDALVASDTNGRVEDVYQFEPAGIGTCGRASGCLSLISAGTGTSESNFLATDGSGGNVFFTTRDRLSTRDQDELIDVYDAREGGGIAGESNPPPTPCSGEACQTPTPSPSEPSVASTSVAPSSAPKPGGSCKKGYVKRGSRCVKKTQPAHKKKAKAKHKANGKRKGSK